ncbi:MAG TPA: ABC transporter ATP-binding protein [Acidiferrobacteraceae bacterium]|nr:ABC transporter ATP-binding protein [Acidiferrobacteraceae bacterium]
MSNKPVIEIRGLSKRYTLGASGANSWSFKNLLGRGERLPTGSPGKPDTVENAQDLWALKDINLDIYEGERIGIVGRNGAGKSTLLKILSRVIYPTEGEAVIRGRVTSLLEVGTGFNSNATGRQNIYLNASLHGLTHAEIDARIDEIIEFSEIKRFINTPIKHYSSGMRARLAFSVAAHLDPDILMLDEVLSVGDMAFQQKCLVRMKEVTKAGRTLIFVSHSMDSVQRFCDRCVWIDSGRIRASGYVSDVTEKYISATMNLQSSYVAHNSEGVHEDSKPESELASEPDKSFGNATESQVNQGQTQSAVTSQEPESNKPDGDLEFQSGQATLRSAFIIDKCKKKIVCTAINQVVGVAIQFKIGQRGIYVPSIALHSPYGELIFWSVPSKLELDDYRKNPGLYEAIAWIPENFLNVGTYEVSISLVDPSKSPFERFFYIEKALQLQAMESKATEKSSRGIFPRDFPGSLRPALDWDIHPREWESSK